MITTPVSVETVEVTTENTGLEVLLTLESDSGPSLLQYITSLREFHITYQASVKSESYEIAEKLLTWGYRLQVIRVNPLENYTSSRLFKINSESIYSSPEKDVTYSSDSYEGLKGAGVNSQTITFTGEFTDPVSSLDKKLLTLMFSSTEMYSLLLSDYLKSFLPSETTGDGYSIMHSVNMLSIFKSRVGSDRELTYEEFLNPYSVDGVDYLSLLNEFFTLYSKCELTTIGTREWEFISTDSFYPVNTNTFDSLEFTETDTGKYDLECAKYEGNQVITFYSLNYSNIENLTVKIVKSGLQFLVSYYLWEDDTVIYSEQYRISATEEAVAEMNTDSSIIYCEVNQYSDDNSISWEGEFTLSRTKEHSVSTEDYDDLFSSEVFSEGDLALWAKPDIILDLYPKYEVAPSDTYESNRETYIKQLKLLCGTSLIFSDLDLQSSDSDVSSRVVTILPSLNWYDLDQEVRGYFYLLYLLPTYDRGGDTSLFSLVNYDSTATSTCATFIKEEDYKYLLSKSRTFIPSEISVRPILSIYHTVNTLSYLVSSNETESETEAYMDAALVSANELLGTDTTVSSFDYEAYDQTVIIEVIFKTSLNLFDSYSVRITLQQ